MKILIVVDMQNDFITGVLGSEMAKEAVEEGKRLIGLFPGPVIFTKDTHNETYLESLEGRKLPLKHCISGSEGWQLATGLTSAVGSKKEFGQIDGEDYVIFEKTSFGDVKLAEFLKKVQSKYTKTWGDGRVEKDFEIHLCGLCTDICVITNCLMLKAYFPNVPLVVHATACAGTSEECHESALKVMESCQVEIVPKLNLEDYFCL